MLLATWQPHEEVGFPPSSAGKESACNAEDLGLIPGLERSPGEGIGNPLHYSRLENPIDRGAWQATDHGITRVGHNLMNKPPPPHTIIFLKSGFLIFNNNYIRPPHTIL